MTKPDAHAGQKVSLSGTWVLGFESSHFVSDTSASNFDIWVEVSWTALEQNSAGLAERLRKRAVFPRGMKDAEVRITLRGEGLLEKTTSASPLGGFGHFGAHPYRLSIERISQLE